MDSYPGDFPFGIMDVVELLHLRIRRRQANSVYVDCPFCGDRRGKMNVNFVKNVWRCNYCDEHGGMLALYARLNNTTTSDAYWEIGEALCNDFHRERPNSGYEMAGNQQAGTGSPVSGTQTDLAGYERRGELKTVQQAERASGQEIHQTLSLLLAMLPLQPAHRNHLHSPKRGLSDEQIDRNPDQREPAGNRLPGSGKDHAGIFDCLRWEVCRHAGSIHHGSASRSGYGRK